MSESDAEKQNSDWHSVPYKRRNNNNNNSFSPPPGSRKDYKINNNNGFKSERNIDSNNNNNQKNGSTSPTNNSRPRAAPSPTRNFKKAQPGRKSNPAQNGSNKNQGIKINLRNRIDPVDYEKVRVIKSLVAGYSEEEIYTTLVENNKDVEQVIHQLQEQSKTKWSSVVQESIKGGLESSPNTRAVVSNYSAPEEIPPPKKKTRAAKNNQVTPAAPKVSKTKQKKSKNAQQQYKKKASAPEENKISTEESNENELQDTDPQGTEPTDPEPKKPDPKEQKMKLLQEELKAMAEKKELVRTIQKDLENYHATLLETLRQNKMVLMGQKQDLEDQISGLDRQIRTIDSKIENARDDISKFNSEKEQTLQDLDSDRFFGEKSAETD